MDNRSEIDACLEFVRQGPWDWFVTLKHPREKSPKCWWDRYGDAEEAFMQWIAEVEREHGGQYVSIIEKRESGDTLFHVLLHGVPDDRLERHWRWRWFELSGGAAWDRRLDGGVDRLVGYFIRKLHCDVEYGSYGLETLCKGRRDTR
jgi:hypothetical protein